MSRRKSEPEDFLHDEEFISWVINPTSESDKYWKAWLEVHPEDKPSVKLARELIVSIKFDVKKPDSEEKQQVLESIIKGVNKRSLPVSSKSKNGVLIITSIAASLLLVAALATQFYLMPGKRTEEREINFQDYIVKETPRGTKMQSILPDGTKVWLNSESKITYGSDYGAVFREVKLEGEAFFEVEKDKAHPFIVHSNGLKITALGTSFNVNSIRDTQSSEVALVSGKVEVTIADDRKGKVILNPGQKVIHDPKLPTLVTKEFSVDKELGWKNGIIVFEDASFDEIKETLQRWYGVTIHSQLKNVDNWNYTGKFDNQSLEIVLERLAYIKKFQFKIDDDDDNVYLYN